jgi:hypothetical protein
VVVVGERPGQVPRLLVLGARPRCAAADVVHLRPPPPTSGEVRCVGFRAPTRGKCVEREEGRLRVVFVTSDLGYYW